MEQEDSYSYPSTGGSLKTRALLYESSCLQKRSIQDLYNRALLLQCLKYLPLYQKNSSSAKRVKPLVPKFEESYKKVKTDSAEQSNISRIYPVNPVNKMQGLGYACGSDKSNSAHKVKVIKVIPETESYEDLVTTSFGKGKFPETVNQEALSVLTFKAEEKEKIQIEANIESETFVDVPVDNVPMTSTSNDLDRKDMKKLQKFTELCEEYQKKLNITNPLVSEKFKQLATLVIPNLLTHFKSKPFEAVAAAVLLYSCREVDYPITLKQIISVADTKEKLINKCVFSLKEIVPSNTEVKRFKAGEFITVLVDKLKLGEKVRQAAVKIWENIEKMNFIKSIHAVTLAACCLKFACSLSDSDQEFEALALAAGITKMTLKNMYRELFPYRFYFITADCMLRDPQELKQL